MANSVDPDLDLNCLQRQDITANNKNNCITHSSSWLRQAKKKKKKKKKNALEDAAKCVDSDHLEHEQSTIRVFNLLADSEAPYQSAQMRRVIWAFAVRLCSKTRFRMARTIC